MNLKLNSTTGFCFLFLTLICSDLAILLDLPILRQVMGFYLISILPGFLILLILRLNDIKSSIKILLCLGLSIFLTMSSGLLINLISLSGSVSKPLSLYPILTTLNIAILCMLYICYKLNYLSFEISYIRSDKTQKNIVTVLFLSHILIIGVLGALVVQYYENSIFSLLFIALVTLTVVLISFNKFIPEGLYPLAVFLIAFTLLLNRTLTSPYFFGADIHYEYYLAQLVISKSFWNLSLGGSNVNAMLSITILPVVYSVLLNISTIYIYKIIYSFIFAFVPVGFYEIYNSQMESRDAFLSSFFLISFYAFFTVMPWLARQEIAELFIVLLVLLLTIKNINLVNKTILFIIFTSSLIVSHYGATYIFIFYVIFVSIGLRFMKEKDTFMSSSKVLLITTMALFWYIFVSSSETFASIVQILDRIFSAVFNDLFSSSALDPDIAKGLGIGITNLEFLHSVGHFYGIITEILIFIGLFYAFLKYREMKFNQVWFLFALVNMIFLFMNMILPYLASSLNMYRIYQIALLFISPFCIIGIGAISRIRLPNLKCKMDSIQFKSLKNILVVIILVPYFLFNTGFIYEVLENPSSHDLNLNHGDENKDIDYYSKWSYFVADPIPTQDFFACQWISNKTNSRKIYVDEVRRSEIVGYGMTTNIRELTPSVPLNQVIYLGYRNLKDGAAIRLATDKVHTGVRYNITDITPSLQVRNKIYTNDGSVFYT